MTNRERFALTLRGDPAVDRCPVMEWALWWDETIACWEKEGLPRGLSGWELYDYFGLDRNLQFWFPHEVTNCPKPTRHGAPLVRDLDEYLAFKRYLHPRDAVRRMEGEIEAALPQWRAGSGITWYTLEGFFWYPRKLLGIEGHLYAFYDEPDLYHRICEDLLEWQLSVIAEFSGILQADFMTIAEDMSYNLGPMLSHDAYLEFIHPYYLRLIPEIKKHGTRVILDSDGDISLSVPWFIESGIEGILPLEHQAGVDVGALQQQYPDFLWLGGFDKMCLLKDKAAIDAEIERITPMLRRGRFLPSVDHQTAPGTPLENYRYYIARMRAIAPQACKDCPS